MHESEVFFRALPTCLICVVVAKEVLRASRTPTLVFQMPFLATATFAVMILPTLLANLTSETYIRTDHYLRLSWFLLACLVTATTTYFRTRNIIEHTEASSSQLNGNAIGIALLPFTGLSLGCLTQIDPTEYGSVLGGWFAIYLFFARLTRPIQIVAWSAYLLTKSRLCLTIALICIAAVIPFVLVSGRRSDTLFIPLSILTPLWALKGYRPSRVQIVAGLAFVLGVFFLWPVIRVSTRQLEYSNISSLSFSEELQRAIMGGRTNEVVELAMSMDATARTGRYTYGVEWWNKLVFQYASSTIFGSSTKASLMLPTPHPQDIRDRASTQHGVHYLSLIHI